VIDERSRGVEEENGVRRSPRGDHGEREAMLCGNDVEISREDLAELVEASTVLLARDEHRNGHQSDWQRWGCRGGLETARRYGSSWFALLTLRRWGRISPADLDAARVLR
jgi:hypothetical protein